MYFTDLLAAAGIPANQTMLLRHDHRGLSALKQGRDWFGSFISIQRSDRSPVRGGARYVAQFVAGPVLPSGAQTAIFVGLTEVFGRWPWDPTRLPRLCNSQDAIIPQIGIEAVDFGWLDSLSDKIGTTIEWGYSPRSWYQWAHLRTKRVIEKEGDALAEAFKSTPITLVLSEEKNINLHRHMKIQRYIRKSLAIPNCLSANIAKLLSKFAPNKLSFENS